ncbi:TerC family protein [Domibacillus sp. PGB-M46]|nr:TerC family protein [Domibacillus sp. PGB-M46]MCI2253653.1 TerC family protein [Domibacillus sp. PGB-M46]
MNAIDRIVQTYASFFDWDMWGHVLTDPVSWGLIGTLVVMEGLLSADNALVLAVMVRHLPENKRKKALFYGLLGAYTFRFVAIGLGVWLMEIRWVKILGAIYLAWLVWDHLKEPNKGEQPVETTKTGVLIRMFGPFWGTVAAVELMDIAFSVDSVLAAFGISKEVWILLLGGMFGVLMMRTVAGLFMKLIDRVPELETTAYILIGIISIKMMLSIAHIEISHTIFFVILAMAFVGTFVVHIFRRNPVN